MMAENKMEQVAALFGKRLGEEFRVKDLLTGDIYVASFHSYGMRVAFLHSEKPCWDGGWDLLKRLILGGSAVIADD